MQYISESWALCRRKGIPLCYSFYQLLNCWTGKLPFILSISFKDACWPVRLPPHSIIVPKKIWLVRRKLPLSSCTCLVSKAEVTVKHTRVSYDLTKSLIVQYFVSQWKEIRRRFCTVNFPSKESLGSQCCVGSSFIWCLDENLQMRTKKFPEQTVSFSALLYLEFPTRWYLVSLPIWCGESKSYTSLLPSY